MRPAALLIMGPTASGKTDLALRLADHLPVSLISVDSALIYRGMDIGTAKPDTATLAAYPHHLIDIIEPEQSYSVAQFRRDALDLMDQAIEQGKIPLLVGGTMLYFNALQYGLSPLPPSDPTLRQSLLKQLEQKGLSVLYTELQALDPESAQRLHAHDKQRILRALEVVKLSGKPMSYYYAQPEAQPPAYRFIKIVCMATDREQLRQRIAQRFDSMLAQGFEAEVRALLTRPGIHADLPSMRSVGYRQMIHYLQGEWDYQTMKERAVIATRQLAKRQLTWLRREQELHWYIPEQHSFAELLQLIQARL